MCNIGSLLAAGGSLFKGFAGADAANNNADLLETQAAIGRSKADLASVRGNYDEFLTRRKVNNVLAGETAHFASGNVDPTYGSPLVLQGYSAAQGETDAQLIRARALGDRADALTGAANLEGKAAALRANAVTDEVGGILGAGTSFLTTRTKWPLDNSSSGGGFNLGAQDNPFLLNQPEVDSSVRGPR